MGSARRREAVVVASALVLAMAGVVDLPRPAAADLPRPAAAGPSVPAAAVTPDRTPLFGATVDDIGHLGHTVSALAELPDRPAIRVYFDVRQPARYYATAVRRMGRVGAVMGELLDSSGEKAISVAGFQARVESYLHALGAGWYGAEDALRPGAPLRTALRAAFRSEASALG
jgi:hypothetical protein